MQTSKRNGSQRKAEVRVLNEGVVGWGSGRSLMNITKAAPLRQISERFACFLSPRALARCICANTFTYTLAKLGPR